MSIVSSARVRAHHSDAPKGGGINGKGRGQEGHQEGREGEVVRLGCRRAGPRPGGCSARPAPSSKGREPVILSRTARTPESAPGRWPSLSARRRCRGGGSLVCCGRFAGVSPAWSALSVGGVLVGLVPPLALGVLVNALVERNDKHEAALLAGLIAVAIVVEATAYVLSDGMYARNAGRLHRSLRLQMFDGAAPPGSATTRTSSGIPSRFISDVAHPRPDHRLDPRHRLDAARRVRQRGRRDRAARAGRRWR